MKERGIIFNAEMVRAILDGRKTQTRRIMKPQPKLSENGGTWWPSNICQSMINIEEMMQDNEGVWAGIAGIACPHGGVGDRLWVRETWSVVSHEFDDDGLMIDYVPDRPTKVVREMPYGHGYYTGHVIYSADGDFTWGDDDGCIDGRSCWKPSIHMPRWASRITLEVTDVRVERLNDVSNDDAKSEGCWYGRGCGVPDKALTPSDQFPTLWEEIYGDGSWASNPWVWVIEFKRI